MAEKSAYYPFASSSALLQQQEHQLRQYTLATISARERERVRASPEPHLEIMRPVSPFQNKRPLAHQVAQPQDTQQQRHRDQRIWNPQYQTRSTTQPNIQTRPSYIQDVNHPSKAGNSYAGRSSSRAKVNAHREDQRAARNTQRDADISPALKLMNYDTERTSNSSGHGQRQNGPSASNASGMLAPPDVGDMSRSASPEGVKRRNPGWRKPVPKYIPTPPSTPPTATFERLPSARDKDEQVPPMPPPSSSNQTQNAQPNGSHPGPVRSQTTPMPTPHPPANPARRAATDLQVPVMFRDFTSAKTRMGSIQPPAQAHTRHNGMSGLSRATATSSRKLTRTTPLSRTESSNKLHAQVSSTPRAPPQAHTTLHNRETSAAAVVKPSRPPSPERARDTTVAQQDTLVHPQPRKVPSMSQLVAMVMPTRSHSRSPSRTPSPRTHLTTADISGPIPLKATSVENAPKSKLPEISRDPLLSVSVSPPSLANTEILKTTNPPSAFLHPEQVHLPPSVNSSVKSSPSGSPQPSPRAVPAPLPIRPRSPTPAIIPQYAPPPPPFPPPPPNTPVAVPKPRMSSLLQPLLISKLSEKVETTVVQPEEVCTQAEPVFQVPANEQVVTGVATKNSSLSEHSTTRTIRRPRKKQVPPEQTVGDSFKDQAPASGQTDGPRSGQWSMMITERRSSSPVQRDVTVPQATAPAVMNVTEANDRIVELFSTASVRGHSASSRDLDRAETRPNVKEFENITSEHTGIPPPSRAQTTPPRELERARSPVSEAVTSIRKEVSLAKSASDPKLKLVETTTTPTLMNVQAQPRPRPVPVPMNDRAQVSRESGLVTPPDTPPGTMVSKPNSLDEGNWLKNHDHGGMAQKQDTDAKPIPRPQSTQPVSEVKPIASKALMRRRTLIQDEQPSWNADRTVKAPGNIFRPASPIPSTDKPVTVTVPTQTVQQEVVTPSLPSEWKATITNVTRSNISASPSPPILSVEETNKTANVLPRTKPTGHAQDAQTADIATSSKYVIRGVSTEQVQHATMELEFHIHEVEARRAFETSEQTEKSSVTDKGTHLLSSRSPSPNTVDLDLSSTTTLNVKQAPTCDLVPESSVLRVPPVEERTRSRSPVPRRNLNQKQPSFEANVTQERTDESSITTTTAEETAVSDSTSVEPSIRRPAELSSRSHSSSLKRRGRTTRTRRDPATRNATAGRSEERASDNDARGRNPEVSAVKKISAAPTESDTLPKLSSPPQRYQTLGGAKRLPFNGSEASLTQARPKDSGQDTLSSPQIPPRSLPPPTQSQPPARPPRHLHGQHKRLPAPEVTQAYRPPTPPIPSHYKKKSSNDVLPAEPPTFMKPAVHVLYPDTSTSHGHSLSGESVLNFWPTNNTNRGQSNPTTTAQPHKDEQVRPQSPSVTIPTMDDDDEGVVVEPYPQVPPKTRRHEMNANGSSVPNDRPSDFMIQHATRGQVRYPSAPVGQARAHILMLPPSANSSRSRENVDGSFRSDPRSRNGQQPRANKAARSHSEKVLRKHDNVHPVARSRSTPIPSSRQRSRRGFWRIFGLWARVFMSKFRAWKAPTPSASQSSEYYDTY